MADASGPDPGPLGSGAHGQAGQPHTRLSDRFAVLDARLLAVRPVVQCLLMAGVTAVLAAVSISYVPRAWFDYRDIPAFRQISQLDDYGTDTIADMYEAKVVLNDWRDMYTKRGVEQSALEARTWSKEASAPYPPAALLIEAGLYRLGQWTGIGFYGLILGLALIFISQAAWYCLRTRWYVFVLLGVMGMYFSYRFIYVQDCTYLIVLVVVMSALLLARRRPIMAHLLMATAIAVKVSPLYYATNIPRMRRPVAFAFIAILAAAFVVPYFVFENYLYIFSFQDQIKGGWWQTVGALAVSVPFALLLSYVAVRREFDLEERIGWGLVPVAMLLAFKLNVARHLLVVLLVPDKRVSRTVAAAASVALYYLSFGLMRFNSTLPICTALLFGILIVELRQVGWAVVAADLRQPLRTIRMVLQEKSKLER
jgi:hypothetical protein